MNLKKKKNREREGSNCPRAHVMREQLRNEDEKEGKNLLQKEV